MKQESVLSAHPVSDDMRALIAEKLADIERQHQVTVLYACESGSRGWGFASPDSDYDVRFVYVHRLPWYLTVLPGRDVIEQPISGDLDINGWDLRKTLGLLRDSNPTLLEWLRSPIVYRAVELVYRAVEPWAPRALLPRRSSRWCAAITITCPWPARTCASTCWARSCAKKYLYVLRPLLAARWIRKGAARRPCASPSWRARW